MIKKNTLNSDCKVYNKYILHFIILLSLNLFAQNNTNSVTYFEDFDSQGYPTDIPTDSYWMYYNEIHPSQDTWNKFIPGDGNAYVTVDTDTSNDTDWIHPFQSLIFGGVGENHRLEVRMKGAVVDGGLVSFLFTYEQEGSIFNEVDLELVARDSNVENHPTLPADGGWTDARFNTWRNANENTNTPFTGTKKAIVNDQNDKISLIDDEFHIYTIDWRSDRIDFFIDGVLQETITTNIATGKAEIIFGFRQLPWAGSFNWGGTHTMVIDYFKIEPLENILFALDDSYTMIQGETLTINPLVNDSNSENFDLSIISIAGEEVNYNTLPQSISVEKSGVEVGTVIVTEDELTFTPAQGIIETVIFPYTVKNNNNDELVTANQIITVYKVPPTFKPESVTDSFTVVQNSSTNPLDVLLNDSEGPVGLIDGGLTFLNGLSTGFSYNGGVITVNGGTLADTSDDIIEYTPKAGFLGEDGFYYMITDLNGDTSIAIVTISVEDVVLPTATNDTVAIIEGSSDAINISVLANDSFGLLGAHEIESLTVTANGTKGIAVINANGTTIDYIPLTGNEIGSDTFTYTIKDTDDNTSVATVTVNFVAIDNSENPSANNDAVTILEGSIVTTNISVLSNDNFGSEDPHETESLVITTNGTKGTAVVNANGTTIDYTPLSINETGTDTFTYTIKDTQNNVSTATVTITFQDVVTTGLQKPTAVSDSFTIAQNSTANLLDVLANDSEGVTGLIDGGLTFLNGLLTGLSNSGGVISINGGTLDDTSDDVIEYTPKPGFIGEDGFYYMITDLNGDASISIVTISVEELSVPTAVNDAVTIIEGSIATANIKVLSNDSFGILGAHETESLEVTQNGTKGTAVLNVNGTTIDYTPLTENETGSDTFTYTIKDTDDNTSVATVTVTFATVSTSNKPTANDDAVTISQDSGTTVINIINNDDFGTDGRNANDPISPLPAYTDKGGKLNLIGETVEYTPATGFIGTDSFNYTITDATGEADTAVVTITVLGAPIVLNASDDTVTILEGSVVTTNISVLSNDSFGSEDPHETESLVVTTNGTKGTAVLNANGTTIDYTPLSINETGTDTFTYTIKDTQNNVSTATVTITFQDVVTTGLQKPTAVSDSFTIAQNSTANLLDVLANDSEGVTGLIDGGLTFLNGLLTGLSNNGGVISINGGTLDDTSDDVIEYTPKPGFIGEDGFYYMITDLNGDASISIVTISVEELSVPTAANDTVTIIEGSIATTNINVLSNDSFGILGAHETESLEVTQNGTKGTAVLNVNGTTIHYTPLTGNETGSDTFSYTIKDTDGNTSVATVTVTFATVNTSNKPTANDDAVTVNRNSTNNIIYILADNGAGADYYGTDGPHASDPISPLPGYTDLGSKIELDGNTVIYTPKTNFSGVDTFNYTITDASGDASTAKVTVTVSDAEVVERSTSNISATSFPKELQVYPNPSEGNFNIQIFSEESEEATIVLFDTSGKVVYNKKKILSEGSNTIDLNTNIGKGIVFLKAYSSNTNFGTKKLVIK